MASKVWEVAGCCKTTELEKEWQNTALVVSWVVDAWVKVPKKPYAKAWTRCSYKTKKDLQADRETALIPYAKEQVMSLVERKCGEGFVMTFNDDGVVAMDPMFP